MNSQFHGVQGPFCVYRVQYYGVHGYCGGVQGKLYSVYGQFINMHGQFYGVHDEIFLSA